MSGDKKLYEDIGYIKGKVEKIEELKRKIDDLDARMDRIEERMTYMFGWVAGIAGVISFAFYFIKDWIRQKFL